jgi:hypothetical protein
MNAGARASLLRALRAQVWNRTTGDLDHEVVLLTQVMGDPMNEGVEKTVPVVVERVDGEPIKDLADLARALDQSHRKRDVFQLGYPQGTIIAIDHDQATAGRAALLAAHGIPNDRNL